MSIDKADVALLRDVAAILRRGRVADMVHGSWPTKLEALADRVEREAVMSKQ